MSPESKTIRFSILQIIVCQIHVSHSRFAAMGRNLAPIFISAENIFSLIFKV